MGVLWNRILVYAPTVAPFLSPLKARCWELLEAVISGGRNTIMERTTAKSNEIISWDFQENFKDIFIQGSVRR